MTPDPDWLNRLFGPRFRWKLHQWRNSFERARWQLGNRLRIFQSRNKMCPKCRYLVDRKARTCPSCGYRFGFLESTPWGRMIASAFPRDVEATPILIAVNVIFYVVGLALSGSAALQSSEGFFGILGATGTVQWRMGIVSRPDLLYEGGYWRLVMANFLHAGIIHIFFNMYFLAFIGPLVERLVGRAKFVVVYFVSGVGGLWASLYFIGSAPTLGASAAIFGLVGSALVCAIARKDPYGAALRSYMTRIIIFVLIFGFLVPGINNVGHIAGGILGGLVTFVGGPTWPKGRAARTAWGIAESAMIGIFLAAVVFMVFG